MSVMNKVVWSEGMFLNPQHFQQQERYIERSIQARWSALNAYGWGFQSFAIDQQLLKLNKISMISAGGIFADGTQFNFPELDETPDVVELSATTRNCIVYLAIPVLVEGTLDSAVDFPTDKPVRFSVKEQAVKDCSLIGGAVAQISVGKLKCRLLTQADDRSGYTCLELCRVVDVQPGVGLVLDSKFIPPVVDTVASPAIKAHLAELHGLLHQRAEAITARLADARRGGAAEIADYLLLQVINRFEPIVEHLRTSPGQPPVLVYRYLIQMVGELATFAAGKRRPPESLVPYSHNGLNLCFDFLMDALREYLASVYEQKAIALRVETKKYGVKVADLNDLSLCSSARFILAIGADLPEEIIRRRCPSYMKIGPIEQIRQLVNAALPGIPLSSLAVTPRELPHRNGYCYFELDRHHVLWQQVTKSARLALHLGGDFPNLVLELWAIRQ